jgi:hypothetical protein
MGNDAVSRREEGAMDNDDESRIKPDQNLGPKKEPFNPENSPWTQHLRRCPH